MNKIQIQNAIDNLSEYHSTIDNILYSHYSPTSLKEKLDTINDAKFYLESLLDDDKEELKEDKEALNYE